MGDGVPSDVSGLSAGDLVDVKIHRVIADVPVVAPAAPTAADALLALAPAAAAGRDERADGSARVDEYLAGEL